jgi:hypothetical protein
VPAHLLTPPDDGIVALTDKRGVDGEGLRAWLLHGASFIATASDYQREKREKTLGRFALAYAQALVDAKNGRDKAGMDAALKALLELGDATKGEAATAANGEEA